MGDDREADVLNASIPERERAPIRGFSTLVPADGISTSATTTSPANPSRISPEYPKPSIELEDRYIDETRSLRVAVIGAGLAGITASILLPAKVPGVQLTIFEKNFDVAGTWYENK